MTARADVVTCAVRGKRPVFGDRTASLDLAYPERIVLSGAWGPHGLSPVAADLLDLAWSIRHLERVIPARADSNPIVEQDLTMRLREPGRWDTTALSTLQAILHHLGDATWYVNFAGGARRPVPAAPSATPAGAEIDRVALFSAGMDSTCGLGTIAASGHSTAVVSCYTRQKSRQQELAGELGFGERLTQFRERGPTGRGRTFQYRSFFFLCLAAVTARSWDATRIVQFENGVLASAIPPTPAFLMTRHAHPTLHRHCEVLFSALFGGTWRIENPFAGMTKRQCREALEKAVGTARAARFLARTDTCWQLSSPHAHGWPKDPGLACGACVPCIVRRTAVNDEQRKFDLSRPRWQASPEVGSAFRAYYTLAKQLAACRTLGDFYVALPYDGRALVREHGVDLKSLRAMFRQFSVEFAETFGVKV
jgi:7-cyano-7-deazaguanine synthase in queuosine biosynthesis